MNGTASTHRLGVIVGTTGMTKAQAEIQQLYRSSTRNVERLTQSVTRFGHHNFAAFAIFKGLAIYRGFGLLTQQLAEGVQQAMAFEKAMANVNSLLQVGQAELLKYSDYLAELGQQLPLTMQELAEGMYDVVSAGITAEEQIRRVVDLAGKAAVAGITSLKNAVQAGIGTMNAFGKSVDDLDHIYDVHFMTVKMGILTYEQLNQVLGRTSATAALAGQGMETATAALVAISRGGFGGVAFAEGSTRVVRFFQELGDPSTHEAIRKLGIQVFDSFGNMRNAIDIVADLNAKLAVLTEEARQATIRQIFTNIRSAQGFQVLSEQIDIWREAQMKSIFSTDAMTDAFAEQMKSVSATMTMMANKFTAAMRDIVATIHPILKGLNRMFDALGQNMLMIAAIIGVMGMKYMATSVIMKMMTHTTMLYNQQQEITAMVDEKTALAKGKLSLATQLNILLLHEYIAAKNREALTVEFAALVKQRSVLIDEKEILVWRLGLSTLEQSRIARMGEIATLEQEIIAHDKLVLTKQKELSMARSTLTSKKMNIMVNLQQRDSINNKTLALGKSIATGQLELFQLQYRKVAIMGNVIAMGGMIAGMGLMTWAAMNENEAMRVLGASVMAFTIAIQIYISLLPTFLSVQAAKTAAIGAETASWWALFTAQSAATGGLKAVAGAAGVAIAMGVIIAATISLGSAMGDTADKTNTMADSLTDLADVTGDTTEGMTKWIKELIRTGDALDEIITKIRELETGVAGTGMSMAAMQQLIKYGYTTVGGVELMQIPTGAFPEKIGEGTTDFEMALKSLGYTSKEILAIHQEDATLLLKVQDELLAIEDTVRRNAYTTLIFGEKFGQAVISTWDVAGKKFASASSEVEAIMEYAERRSADIKQNITDTLVDAQMIEMPAMTLEEVGKALEALEGKFAVRPRRTAEGILGDVFKIQMPVEAFELIPEGIKHAMLEGAYAPKEMSDDFRAFLIDWKVQHDEAYIAFMEGTKNFLTFTDIATEAIVKTMAEILTETKEHYDEWMDSLKDIMKIDDMIDSIVEAGDTLDEAGYEFMGVAGNWDELGEKWAKIQKMWMGLQMMQTLMSMADAMAKLPEAITGQGAPIYAEPTPTERALEAKQIQSSKIYQEILNRIVDPRTPEIIKRTLQRWIDNVNRLAQQTEQIITGYEPVYGDLREDIYTALMPIFEQMAPGVASGLSDVLGVLLGNLADADFWKTFLNFDAAEEDIIETIEEMADKFLDTVTGAGGFSDAITAFVEHGEVLDSAGHYFRGVAENWYLLGEEWARIQSYFKVTEMINSFIQAANAMKEYGVALPEMFQENMFALMQVMATNVLPDFQSVIDSLLDQIGTEGFWGALAEGMAEAQITQSNSIVLAPYIVIEERADAEEIIGVVHEALVEEAKRAGFTWGG